MHVASSFEKMQLRADQALVRIEGEELNLPQYTQGEDHIRNFGPQ